VNDNGIKGGQGHDPEDVACAAKWMGLMIVIAVAMFIIVIVTGCRPPASDLPLLR
jgi:hypothetical protein